MMALKNFLLSPITMILLIKGSSDLTVFSIITGGMFSPPAVIIISKGRDKIIRIRRRTFKRCHTFNSARYVVESIFILSSNIFCVKPSVFINYLSGLIRETKVTHKHVTTFGNNLKCNKF